VPAYRIRCTVVCLAVLLSACGAGPSSQATAGDVCRAYFTALFQGDNNTMYALVAPVADEGDQGQVKRKTLDVYLPNFRAAHAAHAGGKVKRVETMATRPGESGIADSCTVYYALPGNLELQQIKLDVSELADGKWYLNPGSAARH